MYIQDVYLCVCVCVWGGGAYNLWVGLEVLHAVNVGSVWTNSAVIVAELLSGATAETLKQQAQTSAMNCVCF